MEGQNRMQERNRMEEQEKMEADMMAAIADVNEKQAAIVNGMMKPEFAGCSFEEKTLTLRFPVMDWERNRAGSMHGGMIGAAFDIGMGFLARYLTGKNFLPTISLETVFIRPIFVGDALIVNVKANFYGQSLIHLYGEGYLEGSGKLAATVTASYLNKDTSAQDR
ncbi:MAG TPA: hotdog fold domain-containing protein [Bacillota bacterium]|nr:hotdog fold domain-containing protein [Bacillota bacterium]